MTPDTRRKRRIMREFTITELSLVDRPAQEHARMTIMKRRSAANFDKLDGYGQRSFGTFEEAVEAIRRTEGCPGTEALQKAREDYPELFERYQREGAVSSRPTFEKARPPDAVRKFDNLVSRIMIRDDCSRLEAMQRARTEEPEAFDRYQAA